jgi:hypothetical protein
MSTWAANVATVRWYHQLCEISGPPVTFVYAFTIAFVVVALCSVVWRYEPNPFVTGFLTAIIYLTGLLAILSKLG